MILEWFMVDSCLVRQSKLCLYASLRSLEPSNGARNTCAPCLLTCKIKGF